MTLNQHELGSILYTHGNKHICELGVCDKKMSFLWDQVDQLFLDGSKFTVNLMPAGETIGLRIISTTGHEINVTQRGLFRVGRKARESFWDFYQFIVSKIIDRQWSKLTRDLAEGRTVNFDEFHITSSAIYRKKFFRGYHIIDLGRLTGGYQYLSGDFYIFFIDDKGREMAQYSGPVRHIPNIHLVQAFLLSLTRQNSGQ